jgi:hypothetical protein
MAKSQVSQSRVRVKALAVALLWRFRAGAEAQRLALTELQSTQDPVLAFGVIVASSSPLAMELIPVPGWES